MGLLKILFSKNDDEDVDSKSLASLNVEEKDMIRGIVELSETTIKEIMIPRIDVVFIPEEISKDELFKIIVDSGHSRFPVYKNTIDNVIGVVYAKDLLSYALVNRELDISEIIRRAYFVPESMKLDALLRELKKRRVHIAVAVDEYGGVSGIVSLEDVIEEIVGDIQDEFDNEEEEILKVDDHSWLCDARVDLEDLNSELNADLPEDDFDTLGGFVFDMFGKIPVRFEKVSFGSLDFIIQQMEGHKIKTVKIVRLILSE